MTSEEINALPDRVRRFIHDLETRCDPAGEVRQLWQAREQVAQLTALVAELRGAPAQCCGLRPDGSCFFCGVLGCGNGCRT